jgi:hypothetical protein
LPQQQQQQRQQQQLCTLLLQQLDALGWHHIGQLAPDLSSLSLQLRDAAGRLHTAELQLPAGFPVSAPVVTLHLPKPFKLKWLPGHNLQQLLQQLEQVRLASLAGSLRQNDASAVYYFYIDACGHDVHSICCSTLQLSAHRRQTPPTALHPSSAFTICLQALDSYQALWTQLEDIDRNTQLLDPPQALAHPYATCSRCIALGNGASCQLQLSAATPQGLPAVIFHGPSSIVARLQAAWYGSAAQQWDEQQSVRENLQAVLQVGWQQCYMLLTWQHQQQPIRGGSRIVTGSSSATE